MGIFGFIKKVSAKLPTNLPAHKTGGPVVKTGPTRGQVRSRTGGGQFSAKRSDAGVPRKPK